MNQKPLIKSGQSMLNSKLGKTKSSADLLMPFRTLAELSPASHGDMKKFFLNHKPEVTQKFDFGVVEESMIEATPSRKSLFDKIDEANKSVLKDHSIMSKESIECD